MKSVKLILLLMGIFAGSFMAHVSGQNQGSGAAKADLKKALDSIDNAFKNQDAKTFVSFLADDGLYIGTDPKEYWNKAEYAKLITEMMAKPRKEAFKYDKREIRMGKDGNSAIVVSEFMAGWSKIPIRDVSHFIKVGNKWKIDFSSVALVPKNEELDKLSKAVTP